MISSLRGALLSVTDGAVVVEVGGVGFRVAVTSRHARLLRVGHEVTLSTALIVREDAFTLYGFDTEEERALFDLLLGVSGVGPKSALGVLGDMTGDQIADAVSREDDAPFRKVSGIGPKTAKLIVVQLAGKLLAPAPQRGTAVSGAGDSDPQRVGQLIAALVSLGWAERAVAPVAEEVLAEAAPEAGVPTLLRLALGRLGTHGQELGR